MPKLPEKMLRSNTPVEDYRSQYGLWVKREDLSCLPPGPPFSKTRGVYSRVKSLTENVVGVLDTYHSQAGHAVARACQLLGKTCINFYPEYRKEPGPRAPQLRARELGAELRGLQAGRSCILYHQARKQIESVGGYMMPNALKLHESVTETAKEVANCPEVDQILIPASSGTIASGVLLGFRDTRTQFIIHLGYDRSESEVITYLIANSGVDRSRIQIVNERYAYKDRSKAGPTPPWPCNEYYDLKAFRWWLGNRDNFPGSCLLWNIG